MAIAVNALADTQRAFDGVAPTYGTSNERNPLLSEMRSRTLSALFDRVAFGSTVIDLGCGPGSDAAMLARAGFRVTAIDWSPAMVDEAVRRVEQAGVADRVDVRHLGLHELPRLAPRTFDAALSNFGPLNCVADLRPIAAHVASRLRPGGVLVASVIGRVCPWEIALYLSRGDWTRATVRLGRGPAPVPLDGRTVWTRYYTPAEFSGVFAAAGFVQIELQSLGLFAPPPYLEAFARRHPALIRRLQRADELLGSHAPFRAWGDHFLIVLEKRATP